MLKPRVPGKDDTDFNTGIQVKREIIDGVLYDTGKATRICSFEVDSNVCESTYKHLKVNAFAILFISPKGKFFIQQFGRLYTVNEYTVKQILATHIDEYIKYIGEVEEA